MNPSTRSLIASVAVAVCLWPAVADAQAQDALPSEPSLTVEQIRSSFTDAGFQVQQAHTWDWTSPPVTSLEIRDRAGARLLMVLVYANPAAAQTAHLQTDAHDEAQTSGNLAGADSPHLVDGYGPSLWKENVALVQTTPSELDRLYQAQNDRDNCVDTVPNLTQEPDAPSGAVDVDFQQALVSTNPSI